MGSPKKPSAAKKRSERARGVMEGQLSPRPPGLSQMGVRDYAEAAQERLNELTPKPPPPKIGLTPDQVYLATRKYELGPKERDCLRNGGDCGRCIHNPANRGMLTFMECRISVSEPVVTILRDRP